MLNTIHFTKVFAEGTTLEGTQFEDKIERCDLQTVRKIQAKATTGERVIACGGSDYYITNVKVA